LPFDVYDWVNDWTHASNRAGMAGQRFDHRDDVAGKTVQIDASNGAWVFPMPDSGRCA
jgi:hypothetical protein